MAEQQKPAIRNRIWIGGKFAARDPVPIQVTLRRFEVKTRTSNLGMRVDRCFTLEGMPNVHNRAEIVLPWPDLRESGLLEHVDILANIGQPFELGLWKHVYDVFDGDGESKDFLLQRRLLLPTVVPATEFDDYPTRVIVYDGPYTAPGVTPAEPTIVEKTSSTIDTGDPSAGTVWIETDGHQVGNVWVTKIRFGTAPPDFSDCVVVPYLPLYVVVVDQESPRSYERALVEQRGLRLVEFG